MPARKKKEVNKDVDALLKEAQFAEPEKIVLRWKGKDWELFPISALDPRLISNIDTVDGVVDVIEAALVGVDPGSFPMPRGVPLKDGRTEMSVFLDAWSEASNEGVSAGE